MEQTKTITITPNYGAIFERFRSDAELHLSHFAGNEKTFTRKEVYDFVASLRIALGAMTQVEEIEQLRAMVDAGAERMFPIVQKEQWEEGA